MGRYIVGYTVGNLVLRRRATPQMKILNMVIPTLMHFYSLVSNWSAASRVKPYAIQRNVTQLMMSNNFRQYIEGYTVANF